MSIDHKCHLRVTGRTVIRGLEVIVFACDGAWCGQKWLVEPWYLSNKPEPQRIAMVKLEYRWVTLTEALEAARVWTGSEWRKLTKDELLEVVKRISP